MADPLPSWRSGAARATILDFVRLATEPGEAFGPPPARVAAFDNDGTLWCEKPMHSQAHFPPAAMEGDGRRHPSKAAQQPWKAVAENDQRWLASMLEHMP